MTPCYFDSLCSRTYATPGSNTRQAHDQDGWFAFGKFMAIALINGDQMGVELPKYFFAKFLSAGNRVSDLDLIPEEEATVTGLQKPPSLVPGDG